LLLVIAAKLLSALPADSRMNVLLYTVILSFCVWMWGRWVTYSTPRLRKWIIRTAAVIVTVGFGWLMLPGFNTDTGKLIDWQNYDTTEIKNAIDNKRPVLIKFTADWCTSCVVVERLVFKQKDIAELIKQKNALAVKADTTLAGTQATLDMANIYNEPGVPVTVLLLPDKKEVHLRGLFSKNKLVDILNDLPDKKSE
jgi:thiol:disulfide interchange protein DsbD